MEDKKTVISLTTIPPRFPSVGKTIDSLLRQNLKPDSVELYIPRQYRRFPDHVFSLPEVPDGVTVEVIEDDFGPATKLLPCLRKYRGGGGIRIIYCDDDRVYWNGWLDNILAIGEKRLGECICRHGFNVTDWCESNLTPRRGGRPRGGFRNLHRNFPFWIVRGMVRKIRRLKWVDLRQDIVWAPFSGYVDIAEGCGGVMVSPDMFDEKVFDIPPILWAVDDVWISGHLARRGVKKWLQYVLEGEHNIHEQPHALFKSVIEGASRVEANQLCIDYFRENYEVWL